jgi:hypothetical protein
MDDPLFDRLALSLPAPWIDHTDRDFASDLLRSLDSAVHQFNDALVACDFFKPFTLEDVIWDTSGVVCRWDDPLKDRVRFLYARAYVYSLDSTRAFVHVLSTQPGIPPAAEAACKAFLQRFGDIREIRNSLQHIEERAEAKGSFGKRLTGPILDLGSLNERRFGITTGSGQRMEVEISEQFLELVRSALVEIIWSFEWIAVGNVRVRRPEGRAA